MGRSLPVRAFLVVLGTMAIVFAVGAATAWLMRFSWAGCALLGATSALAAVAWRPLGPMLRSRNRRLVAIARLCLRDHSKKIKWLILGLAALGALGCFAAAIGDRADPTLLQAAGWAFVGAFVGYIGWQCLRRRKRGRNGKAGARLQNFLRVALFALAGWCFALAGNHATDATGDHSNLDGLLARIGEELKQIRADRASIKDDAEHLTGIEKGLVGIESRFRRLEENLRLPTDVRPASPPPSGPALEALIDQERTNRPLSKPVSPQDAESEEVRDWARAAVSLMEAHIALHSWEAAVAAAQRFADYAPRAGTDAEPRAAWPLDAVPFDGQNMAMNLLEAALDLPRARALALGLVEATRGGADPRLAAIALGRLGDIEGRAGAHTEALRLHGEAMDLFCALADAAPDDPFALRDLAITQMKLGDTELALGRHEEALEYYEQNVEVRRELTPVFGDAYFALHDLSISLIRVGDVEQALGWHEEALEYYTESLELSRRIVSDFGETPRALHDLSISLIRVGDSERALGRHEAALGAYQESLEIRRRIAHDSGETHEALRNLAVSLTKVGDVELALDRRVEALTLFTESLIIRRWLVRAFGETYETLRDLSISLDRVGDAELRLGGLPEALRLYEESLVLRHRLARDYGETPRALSDLVFATGRVGAAMCLMGGQSRAAGMDLLIEARDLARRLLERYGPVPVAAELEPWLENLIAGCGDG